MRHYNKKDLYSNIKINRTMIGDQYRTLSYKKAINRLNLNNKIVLDAGCGVGIMGFFAARKGAEVISVDKSDIIYKAQEISKFSGLNSSITYIKSDLLKLKLKKKVDVIIHENIGFFLFYLRQNVHIY